MNIMKRILCRRLLKEAIHGSQISKKYGLGTILPVDEVEPFAIVDENAQKYDFYLDKAMHIYYLVNKENNRVLFIGSTNTTDFDKTHTPEEIIRHDIESNWDMIMCISAFVDADGDKKRENNAIDKFGDGFLSSLMSGKIPIQFHFDR